VLDSCPSRAFSENSRFPQRCCEPAFGSPPRIEESPMPDFLTHIIEHASMVADLTHDDASLR